MKYLMIFFAVDLTCELAAFAFGLGSGWGWAGCFLAMFLADQVFEADERFKHAKGA